MSRIFAIGTNLLGGALLVSAKGEKNEAERFTRRLGKEKRKTREPEAAPAETETAESEGETTAHDSRN